MKTPLLLASALSLGIALPATAAIPGIYIENKSAHAVWVTTYQSNSGRQSIVKARCFRSGSAGTQDAGSKGSWTLFELKADKYGCSEHSNWKVMELSVRTGGTATITDYKVDTR